MIREVLAQGSGCLPPSRRRAGWRWRQHQLLGEAKGAVLQRVGPTGDILKITSIGALHQSPVGTILLDVLLDHAGVPDGIDPAWHAKHFLGAPVPGATMATWNLAHVVAAVDFLAEVTVEQPGDAAVLTREEIVADLDDDNRHPRPSSGGGGGR